MRQPSKPMMERNSKIGESPRTAKMANNDSNQDVDIKSLGRELLKDNSKLPTQANRDNGPGNWFVPEVLETNQIPDEKWISKIRDPKWKSKLEAIHGDMTSDVDSME